MLKFWMGFILWLSLITLLCLLPIKSTAPQTQLDKIGHLVVFLFLVLLAFYHPRRGLILGALLFLFGANYGFLIELVQKKIPGRDFDQLDFIMDLSGLGIGMIILGIWAWAKKGKNNEPKSENRLAHSKDI
mgnify:CR=1 FL=1